MDSVVFSFEEVYYAYRRARKSRRFKSCILLFEKNLEHNLGVITYELSNGRYVHGAYTEFVVHDSKKRIIRAALFKDRIVHHVLCARIEKEFEKRFIYDSYVCRVGKGTHCAVRRLRKFLYSCSSHCTQPTYVLKIDISKYFKSIDHEILLSLISRVITNPVLLDIIRIIIDSSYDGVINGRKKGIPIGNLTSQLFANIYLNELDHFVKEKLHCVYYIRYMDDIIVCSSYKEDLRLLYTSMYLFISDTLLLSIHPHKVFIAPYTFGVPFLGYVLFPHYTRLRSSTVKRCTKRMNKYYKWFSKGILSEEYIHSSYMSWLGYTKHANAHKLVERMTDIKIRVLYNATK